MDKLAINIQDELSWCMLFVDILMLIDEKRTILNTTLDLWNKLLEDKSLKISRTMTEYMKSKFSENRNEDVIPIKIDDQETLQVIVLLLRIYYTK